MYRKTRARWVPKELTDHHKKTRRRVYIQLKQRYMQEGDAFFVIILTCDERWVTILSRNPKDKSRS